MSNNTNVIIPTRLIAPPTLDADKTAFHATNVSIHARMRVERELVANLIHHLYANGWQVHGVFDGEATQRIAPDRQPVEAAAMRDTMEHVFAVDEAHIGVNKVHAGKRMRHTIFIVLGNDGWDAISDYSYADEADSDGFKAVMEAFDCEKWESGPRLAAVEQADTATALKVLDGLGIEGFPLRYITIDGYVFFASPTNGTCSAPIRPDGSIDCIEATAFEDFDELEWHGEALAVIGLALESIGNVKLG